MPLINLQPIFLKPHPDSTPACIESIQATLTRLAAGELKLTYVLSGELNNLRIPAATSATRADGLWQHTCCEAFIRVEGSPAYVEFNFAPSGLWQAYAFSDYRLGGLLEAATAPQIECLIEPGRLTLHATIPPEDLPPGAGLHSPLQLGLSAVVEGVDGAIGYWALQHAAGKPDFHHPDTFALELEWP